MLDKNYYQVSGWMVNRLELKGMELQIYAIIYGFTQDGETEFTGSIKYLCEWTRASRPTVSKALAGLVEKGLLIKRTEVVNSVTFNRYKVDLQVVKNLYEGSKETLQGVVKNLYGGSKETLQGGSKETLPNNNNLDNNSLDNNRDNKKEIYKEKSATVLQNDNAKKKKPKNDYSIFADFAKGNKELLQVLIDFDDMRKIMKKPMSERAKKILLSTLEKLSGNSEEQVKIVEQSIVHNWQSVYALKEGNIVKGPATAQNKGQESDGVTDWLHQFDL